MGKVIVFPEIYKCPPISRIGLEENEQMVFELRGLADLIEQGYINPEYILYLHDVEGKIHTSSIGDIKEAHKQGISNAVKENLKLRNEEN